MVFPVKYACFCQTETSELSKQQSEMDLKERRSGQDRKGVPGRGSSEKPSSYSDFTQTLFC